MKALTFCLLTICLIYLQSCTIEKRRYTAGYHIEKIHHEKNHSQDSPNLANQNAKENSDSKTVLADKKTLEEKIAVTSFEETQIDSLIQEDISVSQEESIPIIKKIKNSPRIQQGVKRISENKLAKSLTTHEKSKKGKLLGILSLTLGALGWGTLFIAGAIAANGIFTITASIIFLLGIPIQITSFILGIKTLKTTTKGEDIQSRTAAVFGLLFSGVYLLLLTILLIFLAVAT